MTGLRLVAATPGLASTLRRGQGCDDPRLHVRAFGLDFPNPLGLAAGFDKGEGVAGGIFALGFGSVEVGTLTPRPQPGNPAPRLFRLPRQKALVNRMGFNNAGAAKAARRIAAVGFRPGPLGVNLGKNKDTPAERAPDDYLRAFEATADVGDYFVVNVSSPNTPGLRALQNPASLTAILEPLLAAARARGGKPVLLKLAPDLADEDLDVAADLAVALGVSGLILANTTIARPTAEDEPVAREAGGMSGAPLLPRALALVGRTYRRVGERLPIVGVGGISRADDAYRMIRAGATLVQAYTGWIYGGPGFARAVNRGLLRLLAKDGLPNVEAARGLDAGAK
jgi:dihydroorotate dehydrogenase